MLVYAAPTPPTRPVIRDAPPPLTGSHAPVTVMGALARRAQPGDPITVRDSSGTSIPGTYVRATSSALTMDANGQRQVIPADAVREVVLLKGGNRLKLGLWIGATVGAGWGRLSCSGSPTVSCRQLLGGGTVGGALLGALIGAKHHGIGPS